MSPAQEALAVLYRDVGSAFRHPDDAALAGLRGETAAAEAIASIPLTAGVAAQWAACLRELDQTPAEELRLGYTRVFVGPDPCFLNEGDSRARGFDRPQLIADVMGFYHAFGVDPATGSGERADFIGTQLQFMSLLYVKEGLARDREQPDQADLCRNARRRFAEDHLDSWVPDFCSQLRERSETPFYRALATTLRALLALERVPTSAAC